MKARRNFYIMLVVCLFTGGAVGTVLGAESFDLDPAHSYVHFQVDHLGMAKSFGRFNDISGKFSFDEATPANSQFDFTVAATSVDTGNEKRDTHLRSPDFFNVAKYPSITFTSTRVKKLAANRFEVVGTLTLHGTARSVSAEVVQTGAGKDPWGNHRRGFESRFTLKRSDYGMDKLMNAASDEVALTISVEGIRKP